MSIKFTDTYVTPNSEVLKAIFWDENTNRLYVRLRNENVYGYVNVSKGEFQNFTFAPSKGLYWNLNIKGRYPTVMGLSPDTVFERAARPAQSVHSGQPYSHQSAFASNTSKFSVTFSVNGDLVVEVDSVNFASAGTNALDALATVLDTNNLTLRSVTAVD